MFLIVGLGNPERQYAKTRHNVGFDTIDLISEECGIPMTKEKFKGIYGEGMISGEKVILLKPLTYMNLSGESVKRACDFYNIEPENIIVIYDDASLDAGRMRIRHQGSSGGHNGIKSIICNLGTDVFPRIKIGVGQPEFDFIPHVLGRFSQADRSLVEEVMKASISAVGVIIKFGTEEAMSRYNGFKAN
ncbi:MAG: aminoacyl-tRNA hydrolase [Clostridiaceae bacterium]